MNGGDARQVQGIVSVLGSLDKLCSHLQRISVHFTTGNWSQVTDHV